MVDCIYVAVTLSVRIVDLKPTANGKLHTLLDAEVMRQYFYCRLDCCNWI